MATSIAITAPMKKVPQKSGTAPRSSPISDVAEAMVSGKAIITTLSGAIPEVVGEAAVLVPPDDYLALARAISSVLGDKARCATLGEKAR